MHRLALIFFAALLAAQTPANYAGLRWRDIGFTGYANLETDAKSAATLEADLSRNLNYIRSLG